MTVKFRVQFLFDAAEFIDKLDEKPEIKLFTTFKKL